VFKNQTVSVAKAKRAITDYKKAIGHPEGMGKGVTAADVKELQAQGR